MPGPIGQRIRQARQRAGLSQVELARRLGISKQGVYNMESSKADCIALPRLRALAKILAVSGEYLAGLSEKMDR